jgi:hypothetical protein
MQMLTAENATADLVGLTLVDIELHARLMIDEVVPEPGAVIVVARVIEAGDHYDMEAIHEIPVGPAHDAANRHLRIQA